MAQPVPPGFLFDLRAPLIASSAFFGGAPGVLVAGGSALAYRLYLGGQGVNVGIVSILIKGDVYAWGQIMAACLLGAMPPLLIYAFLMDYYIAGLTAGATKG